MWSNKHVVWEVPAASSPHWTALLYIPWSSPLPPDVYRHLTKLLTALLLLWRESTWEQSQQTQVQSTENHQKMKSEPWSKCAWNQSPMWITPHCSISYPVWTRFSVPFDSKHPNWHTLLHGSLNHRARECADLTQTSSSQGVGALIGLRQPVSQA